MGHTALANTSLPVAAFFSLMVLTALNGIVSRIFPSFALSQGELLTVYAIAAATTGIASSGGVHFLVPALTAPIYYASPENNWRELILPHIPWWFIPQDRAAVIAFYTGSDRPLGCLARPYNCLEFVFNRRDVDDALPRHAALATVG